MALFAFGLCLLGLVSLVFPAGWAGGAFRRLAFAAVGVSALPLLALVALVAGRFALGRPTGRRWAVTFGLALVTLPLGAALFAGPTPAGALGGLLAQTLEQGFGRAGTAVILVGLAVALLSQWVEGAGEALLVRGTELLAGAARRLVGFVASLPARLGDFLYVEEAVAEEEGGEGESAREGDEGEGLGPDRRVPDAEASPLVQEPRPAASGAGLGGGPAQAAVGTALRGRFRLPPLELLRQGAARARAAREGEEKARRLEETLASFGVQVRVVETVEGPVVTRFELQPAAGVKVSRIVSLADDIALAMAATDVRIEAPIPGKSAVGIEIPNREAQPVLLGDVIASEAFRASASALAVALGKDISGRPVVAELDRMPHLLIAGATGSGKSVCLNAIILSLLFRNTPEELRLLLVDPKVVELQPFEGIPHLLAPLVTDAKKAAQVLRRMVREMEARYRLFAEAGVRDLERYNEVVPSPLPKVVIVIDELADLMMVAPVEVEDAVCRLAQMARAAGIHLVVATQRPSVDVITGLIKANIPSRLAFAVSSQVDSRTILDQAGAERLLGKGDMLFAPLGRAKPLRAQGAFVDDREVEAVVRFWREQGGPEFGEEVSVGAEDDEVAAEEGLDALFRDAVRVVVEARQASASLLQRRLRVGYARAARLVEQMESRGIVGPADGAKPREVRLSAQEYLRLFGGGDPPA